MPELSKLAELRVKTDMDLVWIIGNAVELGIRLVSADSAPLHGKATDLYADALMLLTKVEDMRERRRLGERLGRLREALDGQRTMGASL